MAEKKITVLFYIYEMGAGGAARTLLNIINNLDRNKFKVVLVTLNFEGTYEKYLKSDVNFIKMDSKRLTRSLFQLSKIIRQQKTDIVFSTIPRVNTIAIIATLLSFSKAKNVVREADNLGGTFKENLKLRFFGLMYRMSSQIVSLSEGVKENLVKRYKVKPDDIKVVYNPLDLVKIAESVNGYNLPDSYESIFNKEEPVILSAGRLVEQKDQKTLLRAFALVNNDIKSKLVILGEGPLESSLLKLGEELGISDRLHLIGFQSNPYLFMKQADVFVLSSKHEGFSHVIAESLAVGTPVVSTNCRSGPEEVLQKGKYGRLTPVGDEKEMAASIMEMLKLSHEEKQSAVENGLLRAKDFDAQKIVKQYERIFDQTIK